MVQPYLNHVKTPSLFLGSDREMVLYIREMCLHSSQQVVRSPILMYPGCMIKFKKNLSKSLQSAALNRHLLCIHQQPREIGSCFHSVSSSHVIHHTLSLSVATSTSERTSTSENFAAYSPLFRQHKEIYKMLQP